MAITRHTARTFITELNLIVKNKKVFDSNFFVKPYGAHPSSSW